MAIHTANTTCELNGVNLREFVKSLDLERDADEHDITNMGSGGARERIGGLTSGTVTIEWYQSFETSGPYQTLQSLLGQKVTLKTDPTEPGMEDLAEVEVFIDELPEFTGGVGEVSMFTTTWPFAATPPAFDLGALWTATLIVGERGGTNDQTGFNRDTNLWSGTRFGRLMPDRAPAGVLNSHPTSPTRIIVLGLDQSQDDLYIRTNRPADLHGKWIRVGEDWLQMNEFSATSTSSATEEESITDADGVTTWRDAIDNWTPGTALAVGIYDRAPGTGDVLPTDPQQVGASLDIEVGNAGTEWGYNADSPTHGTMSERDLDLGLPDGEVTFDRISWERPLSGTGTLSIKMDSANDARFMHYLWLTIRDDGSDTYDIAVQLAWAGGNNTNLTPVTVPTTDPGWADGDDIVVEVWDRDPR